MDRIHQQYPNQNVVHFDFDVVEESKEFQKLPLTDVPQVTKKIVDDEESKEFQKLSLNDMPPPQPQVPDKKVDDGGKQLEQKPRCNFCYTDFYEWVPSYNFSPCLAYSNSLPEVVVNLDATPKYDSCTYSPLNPPEWLEDW